MSKQSNSADKKRAAKVAKFLGVKPKTPAEERATWEKQGCQGPCVSSKRQTKGEAIKKALGF